jgi:hypothetical protein
VWCPADDADTVIELMPSSPDGYYHKGFALFQLHDYAGAVNSDLALTLTVATCLAEWVAESDYCTTASFANGSTTNRQCVLQTLQAHTFNEGLTLNPADSIMQRGFW